MRPAVSPGLTLIWPFWLLLQAFLPALRFFLWLLKPREPALFALWLERCLMGWKMRLQAQGWVTLLERLAQRQEQKPLEAL